MHALGVTLLVVSLVLLLRALAAILWPRFLSRIDAAFFNLNGAISVVFFLMVLAERLLA